MGLELKLEKTEVIGMNARPGHRAGNQFHFHPFHAYLGVVFAMHLGLALLSLVLRADLWLFPAIPSGPYSESVIQFLLSIPGIFIFDLGLVALGLWGTERRGGRSSLPAAPRNTPCRVPDGPASSGAWCCWPC